MSNLKLHNKYWISTKLASPITDIFKEKEQHSDQFPSLTISK